MKVNIIGVLMGARRAIDPTKDDGAYSYAIDELIGHINDVRMRKHTLEEFADFYCMTPSTAPQVKS